MRTTVTLDKDVEVLLREEMARNRASFKQALNGAIRRGLAPPAADRPVVRVRARDLQLRPGIDPDRMNQLADELETEAILEKLSRGA